MREIDPIRNPSEALLSAALNRLAKGFPRQAPPGLGAQLAQEFRRHHVRRRRKMAAVISIVACVVLAATVLLTLRSSSEGAQPIVHKQAVPTVAPSQNPPAPDTAVKSTPVQEQKPERRAAQSVASSTDQGEFVPVGDPSMAAGDLKVVRLELTGADLRLVGAPVAEDLSDRRLLADIVVSSDGTPYAVRLVR